MRNNCQRDRNQLEYHQQSRAYQILIENNIDIEHYCGGMSACHTCRINIIRGLEAFNEKNEDEKYQLEFIEKNDDNARLSCCAIITSVPESDIEILIPGNTTLNNEDLLL